MQFLHGLNLLALFVLGLTSQVSDVASQLNGQNIGCNDDVERPFAFCRRTIPLNNPQQDNVYGVARANYFRWGDDKPWRFNCENVKISGDKAENIGCCDQNFQLMVTEPGKARSMSFGTFDRHCTVIAT